MLGTDVSTAVFTTYQAYVVRFKCLSDAMPTHCFSCCHDCPRVYAFAVCLSAFAVCLSAFAGSPVRLQEKKLSCTNLELRMRKAVAEAHRVPRDPPCCPIPPCCLLLPPCAPSLILDGAGLDRTGWHEH